MFFPNVSQEWEIQAQDKQLKICNQLIVAANSALIAEAVALADRAGVDTTLLAPA